MHMHSEEGTTDYCSGVHLQRLLLAGAAHRLLSLRAAESAAASQEALFPAKLLMGPSAAVSIIKVQYRLGLCAKTPGLRAHYSWSHFQQLPTLRKLARCTRA